MTRATEFKGEPAESEFGTPTRIGVPPRAEAGISAETVSGAVKAVATETQLCPFQYSMTLAEVKAGLVMLTVNRDL